jgi:hypothetical protein
MSIDGYGYTENSPLTPEASSGLIHMHSILISTSELKSFQEVKGGLAQHL